MYIIVHQTWIAVRPQLLVFPLGCTTVTCLNTHYQRARSHILGYIQLPHTHCPQEVQPKVQMIMPRIMFTSLHTHGRSRETQPVSPTHWRLTVFRNRISLLKFCFEMFFQYALKSFFGIGGHEGIYWVALS